MLYHVALLYALAYGVGHDTFETISCNELHTTFLGRKQHNKTIVATVLSDTVLLPQAMGKIKAIATLDATEHSHNSLDAGLLLKREEEAVDSCHR